MARVNIVVLGAGVVGLSTAINIQQLLPTAPVTIVADKFNQDTTSDGAVGIFMPTAPHITGVDESLLFKWCQDSFTFFDSIVRSAECKDAGMGILSCYHMWNDPAQAVVNPTYKDIVYAFRQCDAAEIERMFPGQGFKVGIFFTTIIMEGRWYLPWLMRKFRQNGGNVQVRTVTSLEELTSGGYDVVVNCSGLRSRDLLGDKEVSPNRGQMLRARAPWIKFGVYANEDTWVIPGRETVTLGGTRQKGDETTTIREEESRAIQTRTQRLYPSLKAAEIAWTWVGIRPGRTSVRVDREVLDVQGRRVAVVHNYGHGANGVALSWGTALHAARLVTDWLKQSRL